MNQIKTKTSICLFILSIYSTFCFSQTNDAIRMIFSNKTFSVTEEYAGNKENQNHKYTFTKSEKDITIVWAELKSGKEFLKDSARITLGELNKLETLFNDCVVKIKKGKQGSTEHSKYTFKDEFTTYEINDESSLICIDEIKSWRLSVFSIEKIK